MYWYCSAQAPINTQYQRNKRNEHFNRTLFHFNNRNNYLTTQRFSENASCVIANPNTKSSNTVSNSIKLNNTILFKGYCRTHRFTFSWPHCLAHNSSIHFTPSGLEMFCHCFFLFCRLLTTLLLLACLYFKIKKA